MKNLMLIFAFALSSCALTQDDYIYSVDKELEPYYLEFIQDGKARGVDLSQVSIVMSFGELDKELGISVSGFTTNYPKIVIDRKKWDANPKIHKYAIYHELGHALLGRGHEENNESIMSSYKAAMRNFAHYPTPMINELFE